MATDLGPLAGYRVLELGSTIAGPFCGRLLADFGAEVIKVELPSGDALRSMSPSYRGRPLYAATSFRNKANVAIDLRQPEGQELARRLAMTCDIVVENFRPGTLEKWGLGYEQLRRDKPEIIMVRISGFGQTGPYSDRPGFGIIGESVGGLRELTGDSDRPPSRVAVSLTDNITGLYGAFGAAMALLHREKTGLGQLVDCALYEAAFSFMDAHVATYDKLGIVPTRAGSRLSNHVPNNLYRAGDGVYVHIAAGNQGVFQRLATAIGRPDMLHDERFATSAARNHHADEVDDAITAWSSQHPAAEIEQALLRVDVPCCRIFRMPDIFSDPQFQAREMLVAVEDPAMGQVRMPGIVPKLSASPGGVRWSGRLTGEDTTEVLRDLCGLSDEELRGLLERGVVLQSREPEGG